MEIGNVLKKQQPDQTAQCKIKWASDTARNPAPGGGLKLTPKWRSTVVFSEHKSVLVPIKWMSQ